MILVRRNEVKRAFCVGWFQLDLLYHSPIFWWSMLHTINFGQTITERITERQDIFCVFCICWAPNPKSDKGRKNRTFRDLASVFLANPEITKNFGVWSFFKRSFRVLENRWTKTRFGRFIFCQNFFLKRPFRVLVKRLAKSRNGLFAN